ncbi:hypothetical protein PM082_015776 [Marasmius tenuissimus]|nr:hypothetical protein PM082_015776 [Marasmius tenuissimus]
MPQNLPQISVAILLTVTVFWLFTKILKIGQRQLHLPPGPPTVPILGNLHIFPTENTHYKLTEWARQYGDIYSLKLGPGAAIVLTGIEAVEELMQKRSASTLDRLPSYIVETITDGLHVALGRFSEKWRALRKAAHTVLTPSAVANHLPIQRAEIIQTLYDILQTPDNFFNHLSRYPNSTIMSVVYGKRRPRYESHEAIAFYETNHLWNSILEPGAHPPIDLLPFLKYIPEKWATWKQLARSIRRKQRDLYFGLVAETEKRMKMGEENGSYMEQVLSRQEELRLDREMIGYLGGTLLEGGSETSASLLHSLVLFLVASPESQRKAQEEIDRVVGRERLPGLEDSDELPYIQALIKETHRIRPVAPLHIPHATTTDEKFRDFVIPGGTAIFVNMYGIYHDPDTFEDPELFYPDRYLKTEFGTKPGIDDSCWRSTLPFGTGRRLCPGIHLAHISLMLSAMNLVWAFDFRPAKDLSGKDIPLTWITTKRASLLAPSHSTVSSLPGIPKWLRSLHGNSGKPLIHSSSSKEFGPRRSMFRDGAEERNLIVI